ncbi:hypothetical protein GCM10010306_086390 [Streptomyces umbrinus]|nr:hypothetical protein GCM10010306_086390 [Streptomyces umbrinus]
MQHPAAVERLDRRGGQAPHPERVRLPRGAALRRPLQHQDRTAREAKLAGKEKTNRAGAHNHYVMHENSFRMPLPSRQAKTDAARSHGAHTALTWGHIALTLASGAFRYRPGLRSQTLLP